MKTMIVVSTRKIEKHVGEEYDVIVEVPNEPTTTNIGESAIKIGDSITALWVSDDGSPDRRVVVSLDAATPFAAMLVNMRIIRLARDGIVIDLPWDKPVDISNIDSESRELLEKLDSKRGA
jgi:hypothetical protein